MKIRVSPIAWGIIAGSILVLTEVFFDFSPPSAYVLCLSCHLRDLINTLVSENSGTYFPVSNIANYALMLTSPLFIVGSLIASILGGEFKIIKAAKPFRMLIYGATFMLTGILFFGCPGRFFLRAGYGDIYGIAGAAGVIAGIFAVTKIYKQLSTR
jgi:hypothetical protein